MAISRSNFVKPLTEEQRVAISRSGVALDVILEINNGWADVSLLSLSDPCVREELRKRYRNAGWGVEFIQNGISGAYFIRITSS